GPVARARGHDRVNAAAAREHPQRSPELHKESLREGIVCTARDGVNRSREWIERGAVLALPCSTPRFLREPPDGGSLRSRFCWLLRDWPLQALAWRDLVGSVVRGLSGESLAREEVHERVDAGLAAGGADDALAAAEEVELDDEREPRDVAALLLRERGRGAGRAAGGEQIVHDEDLRAGLDRLDVHLELGLAVLELVGHAVGLVRELAGLAHRDEARVQPRRERAAEDEAARLDAHDDVDVLADEALGEQIERDVEGARIREERRDVLEEDPGLG